ncbi:D-serine ammonia-lyase [Pollutimonas subterranea]|uniref:Probable D-serine dehydratase n=1 Tax=Pollutimonas subterranea TaxID=2045210 RepID=A0A2N4TZD9_9BURK|nr:D-serine ammonia-lyase [Pollutimonas subterranea]PLC48138.1 D-serine ammonia-lyase [Pollutimonas subterranea]
MRTDGPQQIMKLPQLWLNQDINVYPDADSDARITISNVKEAELRLARFAPLLMELFPELVASQGIIESELIELPSIAGIDNINGRYGKFWDKADHALPIAGSIKARGGIHEVLEFAESLARRHGLLDSSNDYCQLSSSTSRSLFSQYEVSVGSTGNLGLSIGIMSAALGFRATVHMSAEAKQWKKDRLRRHGVTVVEYSGDYAQAVEAGRQRASADPHSYFVDDEQSHSLFMGYAVAAFRLQAQLKSANVKVDAEHPLFVYLPCGVGGAPAGVTFGLKHIFGKAVHCFFVEPTTSPCFLAQMQNPDRPGITVYDVGLDNVTEADGLAVPAASALAIKEMRPLLSGIATTADDTLFADLAWLHDQENIRIEPSAAAAFSGPRMVLGSEAGRSYLSQQGLLPHMQQANHIVWTTGGLFVPDDEYAGFLDRGRSVIRKQAKPQAHPGVNNS